MNANGTTVAEPATRIDPPVMEPPTMVSSRGHSVPHLRITSADERPFIDMAELREYRDLFWLFIFRDLTVRYKQTILGFGWAIVRPLVSMVILTVVFGRIAGIASDGVPYALFALAGVLPWTYFSTSLSMAGTSLITNAHVLTKVYFPRVIIPLAPSIGNLLDLVLGFVFMGILMAIYDFVPGPEILALPIVLLLMAITAIGTGLWASALAIQYRDVNHAMQFFIQLGMYMAPVAWPTSMIVSGFPEWGETLRLVYALYPLAGVIEGFRATILGSIPIPWDLIGIGYLSALAFLVSGYRYFKKTEVIFADVA